MPAGCPDDHPHSYGREGHDSCAQWQHKQAGSSNQTMSSCSAEHAAEACKEGKNLLEGNDLCKTGLAQVALTGPFHDGA